MLENVGEKWGHKGGTSSVNLNYLNSRNKNQNIPPYGWCSVLPGPPAHGNVTCAE